MSSLSLQKFITAVIRTRDVLRTNASITGMDSMRHICLYLMSRFITHDMAGELGVPLQFAWESLIETLRGSAGEEKAMELFCHPSADCLVNHFDRLFGTSKFPFDLKPDNKHHRVAHKVILEAMNDVNMMEVDFTTDILGWVYEQHLKTGSSTSSRDLGQYFTDRDLCNYMVQLCTPGFKHPGVPESICDPTMGTAGFLTSAIKYYKRYYPDTLVDWRAQLKQIHGCDTDDRVAGVARLNIFMETRGCRPEYLLTHNSLFDDLPQRQYDVILANMPFGLKGLKFKDCCERVKSLKLDGTKSEPLFLQLMMVSLNPGGRCAVVVPDGMLVNSSKCHNGTRKYLLDHFELKRVIKMEGSFFMNTGIKPSVLFFENTGKPTTAVEFWKVTKTDDSNLDENEELLVTVPREKFGEDCSLDMRRYLEAEKPVANPAGWPMVKLGDVCKVTFGDRITQKDNTGTIYPVYGSGGDTFRTDKFNRNGKTCKVGRFAISEVNMVMIVHGPYWLMDSGFTVESKKPETITTEFLWYSLLMDKKRLSTLSTGSCQKNIDMDAFYKVEYPCPPLLIQQEIVATLDRVYAPGTTELTDTLKMTDRAMDLVLASPSGDTLAPIVEAQRLIRKSAQMVADVKAQMVAIMKSVGRRGFPVEKVGTLFNVKGGKAISKKDLTGTIYPYYGCNGINGYVDTYLYDGEYIICAQDGSIGSVHLVNKKFYPSNHTHVLQSKDTSKIINSYGAYYLKFNVDWSSLTTSIIPKVTQANLLEIKIPLPPLSFQEAVLVRLEALQSQLTALETLQKQSEDNARFILESYLGAPTPAPVEEASSPVLTAVGGAGISADDTSSDDVISYACDDE